MAKVKKTKRSVIVILCSVVVCVSFAISLFSLIRDIKDIDKEIEAVRLATASQQAENEELRRQLYSNDKDEYVAGIAREEGYINPGERVYYDISVND
ncbi:MAG: septum formation initiator family protein [Clostridia bacterium]|nr:septum formation initiator family protein [Clostridia bacterium]